MHNKKQTFFYEAILLLAIFSAPVICAMQINKQFEDLEAQLYAYTPHVYLRKDIATIAQEIFDQSKNNRDQLLTFLEKLSVAVVSSASMATIRTLIGQAPMLINRLSRLRAILEENKAKYEKKHEEHALKIFNALVDALASSEEPMVRALSEEQKGYFSRANSEKIIDEFAALSGQERIDIKNAFMASAEGMARAHRMVELDEALGIFTGTPSPFQWYDPTQVIPSFQKKSHALYKILAGESGLAAARAKEIYAVQFREPIVQKLGSLPALMRHVESAIAHLSRAPYKPEYTLGIVDEILSLSSTPEKNDRKIAFEQLEIMNNMLEAIDKTQETTPDQLAAMWAASKTISQYLDPELSLAQVLYEIVRREDAKVHGPHTSQEMPIQGKKGEMSPIEEHILMLNLGFSDATRRNIIQQIDALKSEKSRQEIIAYLYALNDFLNQKKKNTGSKKERMRLRVQLTNYKTTVPALYEYFAPLLSVKS